MVNEYVYQIAVKTRGKNRWREAAVFDSLQEAKEYMRNLSSQDDDFITEVPGDRVIVREKQ